MIDPIVWMNAAVIAVGNGEAGELELDLREERPDGTDVALTITVRRNVRHLYRGDPPPDDG